jgi:hypothetical protein
MLRFWLLAACASLAVACGSADPARSAGAFSTEGDAAWVSDGGGDYDASGLDFDGGDAAPSDAMASYPPPAVACEYAFFREYFDKDNGAAYGALRDATFQYIVDQVSALQSCGARITLGGVLSLMIYEGGGAKVAFFNDRCAENAYDKSTTCWNDPKARYSYQYGLAPVHTSNFHPCADVAYTSKMRARLGKAIADAGFAPSPDAVKAVTADLQSFCPGVTPTAVDYYILTSHSAFGVPRDGTGNDLANAGKYPFFTPRVVIDLFFAEIGGNCSALTSDEAAISVFGGTDTSYRTASKQAAILSLYQGFAAASCAQ